MCAHGYVCVYARMCVGAQAQACACMRVALLIQHETLMRHIVCGFSGSTIIFDITS